MAKIYYVGDWAVMLGPCFAETPFNYSMKGTDIFNYGTWLKAALESTGEHQCDSVPTWEFYRNPPGRWEEILREYDVVIFSDVESKNFQLDPSFFDRGKFGKEPLTFPDRVRLTVASGRVGCWPTPPIPRRIGGATWSIGMATSGSGPGRCTGCSAANSIR